MSQDSVVFNCFVGLLDIIDVFFIVVDWWFVYSLSSMGALEI